MNQPDLLTQFIEALTREQDVYDQIYDCSKKQIEWIESKNRDTEIFARLMNEKVELMTRAKQIEDEHQALKSSWQEIYTAFTDEERQPAAEARQNLLDRIEDLRRMEDEITAGIQHRMGDIERDMLSLQKSKNSAKAYVTKKNPKPPRYFDKRN